MPGESKVSVLVPLEGVSVQRGVSNFLNFLVFRGTRPAARTAPYQPASRKRETAGGGPANPSYPESG